MGSGDSLGPTSWIAAFLVDSAWPVSLPLPLRCHLPTTPGSASLPRPAARPPLPSVLGAIVSQLELDHLAPALTLCPRPARKTAIRDRHFHCERRPGSSDPLAPGQALLGGLGGFGGTFPLT